MLEVAHTTHSRDVTYFGPLVTFVHIWHYSHPFARCSHYSEVLKPTTHYSHGGKRREVRGKDVMRLSNFDGTEP